MTSQVMLKVIWNPLTPASEELLEDRILDRQYETCWKKQPKKFNSWVLIKKHLQHGKDLYHNFIDAKKAFDREWHEELGICYRHSTRMNAFKELYNSSRSSVFFNNQVGKLFLEEVVQGGRSRCKQQKIWWLTWRTGIFSRMTGPTAMSSHVLRPVDFPLRLITPVLVKGWEEGKRRSYSCGLGNIHPSTFSQQTKIS